MMTAAVLAFAAGVLVLQQQAALPEPYWLALLPACVALGAWRRAAVVPCAFAAGFLWASGAAHLRMADRLAPELEGRDLEIVGVVARLPARSERALSFDFEVESAGRTDSGDVRVPGRLRLAWYREVARDRGDGRSAAAEQAPPLHPGERWRFTVRLRRPHGNVNPYGFDYEAWLLERDIGATGYVRTRPAPEYLGERLSAPDRIERARESVRDRFVRVLGATPASGILAALAVGDQRAIANEEWRLFQRTGVTHLMSISGLHVTLVSSLVAWLVAVLWRRTPGLVQPLCLRLPARKAAAVAAVLAALGYTLLAGFAVPAQRTFYMVAVVAAALWSGRIVSPGRTLALALGAVLALDPWAVLAPGFWLSFGAVALIFYVASGWSAPEPRMAQWARIQWAITVGLAPAALLLFGQVSVVGPLANAVAIPLVSAIVTPLALAAAVLPVDALLGLAAWFVECLLVFLEWCGSLPVAILERPVPSIWAVLLAFMGIAWLLAPSGIPRRAAGAALLLPAFVVPASAPAPGEAWITTLDVGQGLAVLVRTANRSLLYDAGPAYGPESDSAGRVILPVLRAEGVTRLDALIVTHRDLDHLGGAQTLLESMEVASLRTSLAHDDSLHALAVEPRRCARGDAWEWDGVRFELLHPAPEDYGRLRRRNDLSCVLRVSAGSRAMLLTGDVQGAAEALLVGRGQAGAVRADVLLVPHHGGRSSSSDEFIDAVSPRWAVVSAGYRSRFGHPNARVLERYRARGAQIVRTDLDGAVSVRLDAGRARVEVERSRRPRYWRERAPERAL
jgi:competence protein ComEC